MKYHKERLKRATLLTQKIMGSFLKNDFSKLSNPKPKLLLLPFLYSEYDNSYR
jgi:hypothetical protein